MFSDFDVSAKAQYVSLLRILHNSDIYISSEMLENLILANFCDSFDLQIPISC